MTVQKVLLYPDEESALREKSEPVPLINRRVRKLIRDLKDTLGEQPEAIGLAAPQISVHSRVVLVHLGIRDALQVSPSEVLTLVNPEILESGDEKRDFDGCLSFPGLYGETVRPHYLRVAGLDEWGEAFDRIFEGFDAVVVHHEIDHLDGVLFIDHIEKLDDLYRLTLDERGELIRVPVTTGFEVEKR